MSRAFARGVVHAHGTGCHDALGCRIFCALLLLVWHLMSYCSMPGRHAAGCPLGFLGFWLFFTVDHYAWPATGAAVVCSVLCSSIVHVSKVQHSSATPSNWFGESVMCMDSVDNHKTQKQKKHHVRPEWASALGRHCASHRGIRGVTPEGSSSAV